jgi:hypothetical protein
MVDIWYSHVHFTLRRHTAWALDTLPIMSLIALAFYSFPYVDSIMSVNAIQRARVRFG